MNNDDTDLINFLEVLMKHKWVIGAMTALFVIVSYVYFSSQPKVYNGSVLISVIEASIISQERGIQKIGLPASFYGSIIKERGFISSILSKTNLKLDNGNITKVSLRLIAENDQNKDPGMLRVSLKYEDPDMLQNILQAIVDELLKTNQTLKKGEIITSNDFSKIQKRESKSDLGVMSKNVVEYKKVSNLPVVRQQVKNKIELFGSYQRELNELDVKIKTEKENLKELDLHLKDEQKTYKLTKSLSDEITLNNEIGKKSNRKDKATNLVTEDVNPIYMQLKERLINSTIQLANFKARKEILENETEKIKKEYDILNNELVEKENKLESIDLEYELMKEKYKDFSLRQEITKAYAPLTIGNISVLNPVYVEKNPVSPLTSRAIILSGLIGLLIGIVAAYSLEFANTLLLFRK